MAWIYNMHDLVESCDTSIIYLSFSVYKFLHFDRYIIFKLLFWKWINLTSFQVHDTGTHIIWSFFFVVVV